MIPLTRSGRSVAQLCAGQQKIHMIEQPHLGITQISACFRVFCSLAGRHMLVLMLIHAHPEHGLNDGLKCRP